MTSEGQQSYQKLIDNGFSAQDANDWRTQQTAKLQGGGFTQPEIDAYWGESEPDTTVLQKLTSNDLARLPSEQPSQSLAGDVLAGWQHSAAGLTTKAPTVSARGAGIASGVAEGIGQTVGDLPLSVAGFIAGSVAGAPGGPLASLAAGGSASFAMPEAYRSVMMDHYKNGSFQSFGDFWSRYATVLGNTAKAGVVGAVSAPIGGKAGAKVLEKTGSAILGNAADNLAMASTATTVGAGLDGHVPDASDFGTAAITVLGFHAGAKIVGATRRLVLSPQAERIQDHMQDIYSETGVPPWEQAERAKTDPVFKAQIISRDVNNEPITTTWKRVEPTPVDPYKASPGKIGTEHTNQVEDIHTEAHLSIDDQVDLIAHLEGSADYAKAHGIPEHLVTSSAGAIGRYQVTPGTAKQYGFDPEKLTDPDYNRRVASYILDQLNKRYKGDLEAVLIGYNAGPGKADLWLARGKDDSRLPVETQKYLQRAQRTGAFAAPPGGEGGGGGKPPGEHPALLEGPPEPNKPLPYNADTLQEMALDIVSKPDPKSFLDRGRDFLHSAYDQAVNELGPFRRLDQQLTDEGKLTESDYGIEDAFRSTYASKETAGHFLTSGAVDAITRARVSDESLKSVYASVKATGGTDAGLVAYRLAKRFLEKNEQEIDTGLFKNISADRRVEAAQKLVKAGKAKYEDASRVAQRLNNHKLDYGRDSGLHSDEQVAAWKAKNKEWIPYKRDLEGVALRRAGTRSKQARPTIKAMEGSQHGIIDPAIAEVESFYAEITMADRNRAVGNIVGIPSRAELLGLKKIGNAHKVEILDKDGKVIPPEKATPDEVLASRVRGESKLGPEDFIFYRKGQAEIWRVPGQPHIAQAIRGANDIDADILTKGLRWFASMQRAGITAMPDFVGRNIFRDQITSAVLDKFGGPPLLHTLDGIFHVLGRTEQYYEFVRNGGMGAALVEMDAHYLQRDLNRIFNETNTWTSIINSVKNPLMAFRMYSEAGDAIRRFNVYKRNKPKVGGLKAAMRARKSTLDFVQRGTSQALTWWSGITPFLRPNILGLEQLGQSLRNDTAGLAMRGLAYITVPTVLLYALNYLNDEGKDEDDPTRWSNLPRWQRDNMWILPDAGVGFHVRIPKPPVVGLVFGALVERTMDAMVEKDPAAFKDWAGTMLDQFLPNLVPAVALPIMEAWSNKSSFTGHPLVPSSLEQANGYMQYTENTTEPAKKLARFLSPQVGIGLADVSPIVLENYVREWTGSLGANVLRVLNVPFTNNGQPWQVADIPFVGSFTARNPTMQAAPIQDFYDELAKFRAAHKNFSLAVERTNDQEIDETSQVTAAFVKLDTIAKALSLQYSAIQGINKDETMTREEKRQFIESTYEGMLATAKAGLSITRSLSDE